MHTRPVADCASTSVPQYVSAAASANKEREHTLLQVAACLVLVLVGLINPSEFIFILGGHVIYNNWLLCINNVCLRKVLGQVMACARDFKLPAA